MSPANVPIFTFKSIIPIAATILLIQGFAQVLRCILCIKNGEWLPHLADVEETETMLQHQHEDIAELEHELGSEQTGHGR
jgi:TRAP-type mannitol/chloroaromatic compound transport system permease small subunit